MKLYNTLTRSVDQFTPQNDNIVTMYSCGPTVYDYPQIGNWTAYIRWDILARTIRQYYTLNWYMNVTDVGHLVSDADDGEDKLEKGARREGKTAWEVASFYTKDFTDGLTALNISFDQSHLVKATDHIKEQIALIEKLEENGHTYVIDDGVYFDSTTFAEYGKMARLDLAGLQAGARVELGQKKHASDFALWKFSPKNEQRDMEWDSPWGKGFPGWHIECSAMAMKYLGETLDIHTGGIDHIPVHHTNEIAQSEGATGKQFVRFWLHNNFLQIEDVKISKSLGNTYTLQDLIKKGYTPQDLRMLLLQSHFQTEANFTWGNLAAARTRRLELQAFADLRFQLDKDSSDTSTIFTEAEQKIRAALDDNLNSPQVLAVISQIIGEVDVSNSNADNITNFVAVIDELTGLTNLASQDITNEQKELIAVRETARQQKDWAQSDAIRDQLLEQAIAVKDTPTGTIWRRVS